MGKFVLLSMNFKKSWKLNIEISFSMSSTIKFETPLREEDIIYNLYKNINYYRYHRVDIVLS